MIASISPLLNPNAVGTAATLRTAKPVTQVSDWGKAIDAVRCNQMAWIEQFLVSATTPHIGQFARTKI
jgi:hypothetical protein